ncbi:hypothetical protein JCM15519_33760 [Fundidesulfovibrio butyratiphilus]
MTKKSSDISRGLGAKEDDGPQHPDSARLARLGLVAQVPDPSPGACPDARDLAAFAENPAGYPDREDMLKHLDRCSSCRNVWIALGVSSGQQSGPDRAVARLVFPRWSLVAGSLAVAALLLLMVNPWTNRSLLDPSFQEFLLSAPSKLVASRGQPAPLHLSWEGWSPATLSALPDRAKAYAAGQWRLQRILTGEGGDQPPPALIPNGVKEGGRLWTDRTEATWHELGQVAMLLKLYCERRITLSPGDRNYLEATLQRLSDRLEGDGLDAGLVLAVRALSKPFSPDYSAVDCRMRVENLETRLFRGGGDK